MKIKGDDAKLKPMCPECSRPMSFSAIFFENRGELILICKETDCKSLNKPLIHIIEYDSFFDEKGDNVCE